MSQFYASIPEPLRRLSHRDAVEQYAARSTVPRDAIAGLSRAQLTSRPVPGTWSIQEIVLHLLDSDQVASYRMKRAIAEERPRLDVYDETAFARRLHYHEQDPARACEAFHVNRQVTAALLRRLDESDFQRVAIHPEAGELSLGMFVRIYVHHVDHHLRFIREKRALLKSPLASASG
jgi:hypothetical protein